MPEPYLELSGRNVLTMEFFDGVPIDDLARVAELGFDPTPLVQEVMRAFFLTTVRWGAFHGDVHAGNMMMLRDGRIGVIDWGIVGRLDPSTHRFFISLLSAGLGNESAWPVVTKHITDVYGPAIGVAVGLSGDELTQFFRSIIEPALTRPFGEVSLAGIMQTIQLQMAKAQGIEAHQRSIRAIVRRLRSQRRVRRMADEAGGLMSDFDRGTFLLAKQLMYFERYGRMFVSEVPILNDRAFHGAAAGRRRRRRAWPEARPRPGTELESVLVSSGARAGPGLGRCDGRRVGALHGRPRPGVSLRALRGPGGRCVPDRAAGRQGRRDAGDAADGSSCRRPSTTPRPGRRRPASSTSVPEGTVTSWSWVPRPRPKHPLQTPFAWVLVRFDGADTSFLHVLPAASPDEVSTGMRVRPEFAPEDERVGHVKDIAHFVAVGGAS